MAKVEGWKGFTPQMGTAPARSGHMGKIFYFCAEACRKKFEEHSMKYVKMEKKRSCWVEFAPPCL